MFKAPIVTLLNPTAHPPLLPITDECCSIPDPRGRHESALSSVLLLLGCASVHSFLTTDVVRRGANPSSLALRLACTLGITQGGYQVIHGVLPNAG
jgi:hypothetical protein